MPSLPGQPRTLANALGMPNQPQRIADTIDWNKEQINWQNDRIEDFKDKLVDMEKRNDDQVRLITELMAEKDDLKNQIDVKDGQVAEFKKLSERVDVLTEENSSFQEQFNALNAKVEFYQRKIEKYGLQGEFKTSSNEDSVASSQQQDDF